MLLYRNNLKNREFDKEAPQNFRSERAIIAGRQGASENENFEEKPTQSKTDSSGCFGIQPENAMSGLTGISNFESLKSIALLCSEIDNAWYLSIKDVEGTDRQELAVTECSRKLEQMSQCMIRCVGVVFQNIKLDKETSNSHSRLEVYHKNSRKIRPPARSFTPLDEDTARFYILHDKALWPIQLDPDSNNVLILDNPQNLDPSAIVSIKQIDTLTHQKWGGCFIAAKSPTIEMVTIPLLVESHPKRPH